MMPKQVRDIKNSFCIMLAFLTLTLSGCAVNINTNKYALNAFCVKPYCNHSKGCAILVEEPTAQPGYDADQMIYLKKPFQLQSYSRNRWAAPPNQMLTTLIAQSLRNSGYFKAVVTSPFIGKTQYQLKSRLIKLQHEFFCCPSRVRLILEATLIEKQSHQVINEKVFEVVVSAPENSPYGGVVAANKSTSILLDQLAYFVVCSIEQNPIIPIPHKY